MTIGLFNWGDDLLKWSKGEQSYTRLMLDQFIIVQRYMCGLMLTELLDSEGFSGRYDFLYLPIDYSTGAGLGFAFINFVSLMDACTFQQCFNGFKRWALPTSKVGSVGWSNTDQQGLEANIQRYRNSSVMHHSVPDEHKPIILKNGLRIPFPKSTKKLWPPDAKYGNRARKQ